MMMGRIIKYIGLAALLVIVAFGAMTWAPDRSIGELSARWAQPPSAFLDVAGMSVHLRDEGPRDAVTPIILIHGTGSSLHTWGRKDRLIPEASGARFLEDIENSTYVGFNDLGHIPHEEAPELTVRPVLEFLDATDR